MIICKNTQIIRSGYIRNSYINSNGTFVKSTYVNPVCITDKGLKGKGPKIIKNLKKGSLRSFGYSSSKSNKSRHTALNKALNHEQKSSIIKKLNAVSILNKNTNPKISKIFRDDIVWLKKKK